MSSMITKDQKLLKYGETIYGRRTQLTPAALKIYKL